MFEGNRVRQWMRRNDRSLRRQAGAAPAPLLEASGRLPLRDRAQSEELVSEGWTVSPHLGPAEVDALRGAYERSHGWIGEGFEPDVGSEDLRYRAEVAREIDGVQRTKLQGLFEGWEPFLRSYYCKWPQAETIHLHWDWTCVDESQGHRTYQVWTALQDVDERNGMMWVLPQSHRVDARPRGSDFSLPLAPELEGRSEELRQRLVPVPLRAGESLIFDMGLVHVSSPNHTSEPRLATVVALRPTSAGLVHYRSSTDAAALRHDVDEQWFNSTVPADLIGVPRDLGAGVSVPYDRSGATARRVGELVERLATNGGAFDRLSVLPSGSPG